MRAYRRDLARDPERSLRRRTRGVFSKKSARRGLMILARGSKNWGRERGEEGRPSGRYPSREREEKKKHRGRTYTFLLFAHTHGHLGARMLVPLRVGGCVCLDARVCVCVCPHVRARRVHLDVTYNVKTRRGIARNNYKHRGVTINLPLSFSR